MPASRVEKCRGAESRFRDAGSSNDATVAQGSFRGRVADIQCMPGISGHYDRLSVGFKYREAIIPHVH